MLTVALDTKCVNFSYAFTCSLSRCLGTRVLVERRSLQGMALNKLAEKLAELGLVETSPEARVRGPAAAG